MMSEKLLEELEWITSYWNSVMIHHFNFGREKDTTNELMLTCINWE